MDAGTDVLGENAVLTNAAGAYGPSVSEHMVALTFGMIRKMRGYGLLQDAHDWRALGSVTAVEESTVLVMGTGVFRAEDKTGLIARLHAL